MNELLARAGAWFVAPAAAAPARPAVASPPADLVGVLARAADLCAVSGGVAGELRRRQRVRAALVCQAGPARPGPATPAARGLARRLADRGVEAVAHGALCRVALPSDPDEGVRAVWRAAMAVAGHPCVVALPARSDAYDALLADADQLLLAAAADTDPALTELALASLAAIGPPAGVVVPPVAFLARRLAGLGLARLAPQAVLA